MNQADRIVSSEDEELILVDRHDNPLGHLSKANCHDGDGVLHRAFSLFLFNAAGQLLLQQRSDAKRLWPAYWSNSCCSHPRRGESMETATTRRLNDELGIHAPLEHVYSFCYTASYGDIGSENELCHVYLGRIDGAMAPNRSEIQAIRFIAANDLDKEFANEPERFTPWFKQEWRELVAAYSDTLARYRAPVQTA